MTTTPVPPTPEPRPQERAGIWRDGFGRTSIRSAQALLILLYFSKHKYHLFGFGHRESKVESPFTHLVCKLPGNFTGPLLKEVALDCADLY